MYQLDSSGLDWLIRSLWSAGGLGGDGGFRMTSLTCLILGTLSVGAIEKTWSCISGHSKLVLACLHSSGHRVPKQSKRESKPLCTVFFKPLLVSCWLLSHWPKQVTWPSPESVWERTTWGLRYSSPLSTFSFSLP